MRVHVVPSTTVQLDPTSCRASHSKRHAVLTVAFRLSTTVATPCSREADEQPAELREEAGPGPCYAAAQQQPDSVYARVEHETYTCANGQVSCAAASVSFVLRPDHVSSLCRSHMKILEWSFEPAAHGPALRDRQKRNCAAFHRVPSL